MAEPRADLTRWEQAANRLEWARPPDAVFDAEPAPRGSWLPGGTLNVAVNCLYRHLPARGDVVAFYWEGEPEDRREITYAQLAEDVRRFAAALRALGVVAGDRVALHMGLLPETIVAMVACAEVGAIYSILPAVLPPEAIQERLANMGARVVVTQDGAWRRGVILPLKARADEAVAAVSSVEHTIVVRRNGIDVSWYEGDRWYHEILLGDVTADPVPEAFPAEHPLCIAHLANRRERPTGIVHGSANFLIYLDELHSHLLGGADEVFWFPSEIGWLAPQSHGVFGSLLTGGTSVLYEGMLDTPSPARAWEIAQRYSVTVLAATPSLLRSLRSWAGAQLRPHDLQALRRMITAGEAIEPDLASWLKRELAPSPADLLDAWGQAELGGIVTFTRPGGAPKPRLGIVDGDGAPVPDGTEGELVLRDPWPGTMIGLVGDDLTSMRAFSEFDGVYATGDRAVRDPDGTLRFLGRIDRVMSVSGQLVSLTEVQEAILEHPFVRRAVATGGDTGAPRGVVALIEPIEDVDRDRLVKELNEHIESTLGGLSRPRTIVFAETVPEDISDEDLRTVARSVRSSRPGSAVIDLGRADVGKIARLASHGLS